MDAGWYADPTGTNAQRYWDGFQWTGQVSGPVAPPMGYAQPMVVAPKNPAISLLISFFVPGVGSMINGDTTTGVIILCGFLVSLALTCIFVGIFTAVGFWVWGLIDAYQGAQRWNLRHGILS